MSSESFTALGIDVGGTKIAAGIVSFPNGELVGRRQIPTEAHRGSDSVFGDLIRLMGELAAEAQRLGLRPDAAGLGLCELVSPDGDILSSNSLAWQALPVRPQLSHALPLVIEADVRAAALAEALFGAGRPFRTFLYVTIGTGISSCLILEGKPYVGARGATGTIASSPLPVIPCPQCGHIDQRSLEDIASGPGILSRYNAANQFPVARSHDIITAASAGLPAALQTVVTAGKAVGSVIGLLVNTLDPEAVVVGGGLGLSKGAYWQSLEAAARDTIWSDVHRHLPILQAATGNDAGVIGAAAAAWRKLQSHRVFD